MRDLRKSCWRNSDRLGCSGPQEQKLNGAVKTRIDQGGGSASVVKQVESVLKWIISHPAYVQQMDLHHGTTTSIADLYSQLQCFKDSVKTVTKKKVNKKIRTGDKNVN